MKDRPSFSQKACAVSGRRGRAERRPAGRAVCSGSRRVPGFRALSNARLGILGLHRSEVAQVALVADQHDHNVAVCVVT